MEFLKNLGQFILFQIATVGFMLIAPLLYLIPLFFVVLSPPNNDVFPILAVAMTVTGPFVSAFWTMIVCMMRRVHRIRISGGDYTPSLEGVFAATGWMLYGFFGTVVAEVLFLCVFHLPRIGNTSGLAIWFAVMPFVIFAPLLLVWAWSSFIQSPRRKWRRGVEDRKFRAWHCT